MRTNFQSDYSDKLSKCVQYTKIGFFLFWAIVGVVMSQNATFSTSHIGFFFVILLFTLIGDGWSSEANKNTGVQWAAMWGILGLIGAIIFFVLSYPLLEKIGTVGYVIWFQMIFFVGMYNLYVFLKISTKLE